MRTNGRLPSFQNFSSFASTTAFLRSHSIRYLQFSSIFAMTKGSILPQAAQRRVVPAVPSVIPWCLASRPCFTPAHNVSSIYSTLFFSFIPGGWLVLLSAVHTTDSDRVRLSRFGLAGFLSAACSTSTIAVAALLIRWALARSKSCSLLRSAALCCALHLAIAAA